MYRIETVTAFSSKRRKERIMQVIDQVESEGFEFLSMAGNSKVLLIFREKPAVKIQKEFDKGLKEVKSKVDKIVQVIKG